jgi:hypothetical protein
MIMGYDTRFRGSFKTDKPVTNEFMKYINGFNNRRHMDRNNNLIKQMDPNWQEHCFKNNLGNNGEYYLVPEILENGENPPHKNFFGQDIDISVINHNMPPVSQPGLWCQWHMPDNNTLEWDGGEKFYNYISWLKYLIKNFFQPENYTLTGEVEWWGEEIGDSGTIILQDNEMNIIE